MSRETCIAVHEAVANAIRLDHAERRATERAICAERRARTMQRFASRADASLVRILRAAGGTIEDMFYCPARLIRLDPDSVRGWRIERIRPHDNPLRIA